MNTSTHSVVAAIAAVKADIRRFEQAHGRAEGSVELLAVSKRKPATAIVEALDASQIAFGENYVDEGMQKIEYLNNSSIQWHFIGAIQSRKTAQIAENFDWAHGVDRLKVAKRLSDQRPAQLQPLNICLQVNLDNEPGKAGVPIDEIAELADQCAQLPGVALRGLMAIPLPRVNLDEQRAAFARLRHAQESLLDKFPSLTTLSMGMSGDMEAAIAEGSTLVRVGTAIFGARD